MRDLWDEERARRKTRRRMRRLAWWRFPVPPPVGTAVPPEMATRRPAPLPHPAAPPIEIETPYVSPLGEVALDTNIERAGVVDEVASDIDRAAELLRSLGKRSQ